MKWGNRCLKRVSIILCLLLYSGCGQIISYRTQDEVRSTEEAVVTEEVIEEDLGDRDNPSKAPINATYEVIDSMEPPASEIVPSSEKNIDNHASLNTTYNPTDQELIDTALEYCQASNDFWEQGDLDNAIDALDKAYSITLNISGDNTAEVLQQKEDLRFTISKRIIEVYSSRFTVANGSHKEIPLDMNEHVKKAIDLFKGKEKKFFLAAYARSGRYRPAIVEALKEAGLPEELSWLPLIESGFKVRALSKARALGMWQFMASTGSKFGLKRDTWIDERMDPEKSTNAAIAYLTELHQIFGDWTTVLAAYNCGEARVLRYIKTQRINYLDNFWDLYEKLPSETAFFVPKFLAVLHILNNPEKYGFTLPPFEEELEYEKVTINKQILIKTIAKGLDIGYSDLKDLNPELRQDLTPKTIYSLKVPIGKGEILLTKIDDIPAYHPPVTAYVEHRVRSGESLSVIAERYKTSIKAIMNMNNLKNRDYLRVGWKLKIPTGKTYASSDMSSSSYITEYVVQQGDSLWKIANRYNTTVQALTSLNNLQSTTLQIGQVLTISPGLTASKPVNTQEYTVKKGDSPYLIAKRNQMNLHEFLKLNNLTPQSTIFPGQIVKVVAE